MTKPPKPSQTPEPESEEMPLDDVLRRLLSAKPALHNPAKPASKSKPEGD